MPVKRDLQKEREALERLSKKGVDAKKNPDAQKLINEETYGTYEPTFNKEFDLGRKQDRIDATPRLSTLKQQAGDRANELRVKEDANIADAFQIIKDPSLRESLMRRSRVMRDRARENNLGEVMQSYQLDQERTRDDYQRALERALGVESQRMDSYKIAKEEEAAQAQREFDLMMKQLSGGRGGGGGRRGGGRSGGSGSGKFTRVPNESGGYSFFDGAGNPVTPQEYALNTGQYVNKVLSGSQDMGDQQFLIDYQEGLDLMKSGEISPEEFNQGLATNYPHIYEQQQAQAAPEVKKNSSSETPKTLLNQLREGRVGSAELFGL